MHHLILGYGYCGYYLAQELLNQGHSVTAVSRHLDKGLELPQLNHIIHDLNQEFHWNKTNSIIYYLIPPPSEGDKDSILQNILTHSTLKAHKIIYFGSSGVYGNQHGKWVDEETTCSIENDRQRRRLNAEQQWLTYCQQHSIECIVLRIAGIYGPSRIPIEAAHARTTLIERDEAPYTNHIYVKDLAAIARSLATASDTFPIYNISDGTPKPMGSLQQQIAELLHLAHAPYESWAEAFERASPMKREFMQGSKRLSIKKLKTTLGKSLSLTSLNEALIQSL